MLSKKRILDLVLDCKATKNMSLLDTLEMELLRDLKEESLKKEGGLDRYRVLKAFCKISKENLMYVEASEGFTGYTDGRAAFILEDKEYDLTKEYRYSYRNSKETAMPLKSIYKVSEGDAIIELRVNVDTLKDALLLKQDTVTFPVGDEAVYFNPAYVKVIMDMFKTDTFEVLKESYGYKLRITSGKELGIVMSYQANIKQDYEIKNIALM